MKTVNKLTRDQAIGAYIGAAVGDAYGAPFEFMSEDEVRCFASESFGEEARYFSGGAHDVLQGEWTDDTAMARCITDSYIHHQEIDERQIMENFWDWMTEGHFGTRDHCFDIGGTCRGAITLWRYQATSKMVVRGQKRPSEGNGGIMRLAPVVTFNSQSYFDAVNDAMMTSRLTHKTDLCDKYAEAVMDVIFKTDLRPSMNNGEPVLGSGFVYATFWNALFCFTVTNSYLDCIREAVLMGGDTDTTAAVAGMIAGAHYGASGIPENLVDDLVDSPTILAEAEALYQMGRTERGKFEKTRKYFKKN